jgi:PKD repeat protein
VLTVVDGGGLAGSATVAITVTALPNVPPVAVASANKTSGQAPLVVNFTSEGSIDPDGTIASYRWDFGDGSWVNGASASNTYTIPGSYNAILTVTDDRGATATSAVPITVNGNPDTDVDVGSFNLQVVSAKSGSTATATVYVLDRLDRAVSGVTISLHWSGVVSGNSSGTTGNDGKVILTSPKSKKGGSVTATVTAVTPPAGRVYDPNIRAPMGSTAPTATTSF